MLREEEIRYLDKKGLHGINFTVTKEQFDYLLAQIETRKKQEHEAKYEHAEAGFKNGPQRYYAEFKKNGEQKRIRQFHVTAGSFFEWFGIAAISFFGAGVVGSIILPAIAGLISLGFISGGFSILGFIAAGIIGRVIAGLAALALGYIRF